MSYAFENAQDSYGLNIEQMTWVRLVMVEAGAIVGDGLEQAFDIEVLAPGPEAVPGRRFLSNDDWPISDEESRYIAGRLRAAIAHDVAGELVMFFDDHPPSSEIRSWVEEFAAFNERAAENGGYRVR